MANILIFESSASRRRLLDKIVPSRQSADFVTSARQLFNASEKKLYPVTVADVSSLKKTAAADLISRLKSVNPDTTLLILSDSIESSLQNVLSESQVFHIPFTSHGLDDLSVLLRYHGREATPANAQKAAAGRVNFIGKSRVIRHILEQIEMVKDADIHLLITGETGSGKTELARYIHSRSRRNEQPFVHINCAAIPDNLLESELFGYKRGAFTGAYTDKTGIFGSARRGTVFLDEIGEIPSYLQAKLLKVVDEKDYYPVGSTLPQKVYARIITATNTDLVKAVKERRFREDLFYRLNTMQIHLPPLRERTEDIPELFVHFVKIYSAKNKLKEPEIDPLIFEILQEYSWPGNVRELQNTVERIVFRKPDRIEPALLPDQFFVSSSARIVQAAENLWPLKKVKSEYAKYIFKMTDKNKSQAARILGIDIKTMRKLLRFKEEQN